MLFLKTTKRELRCGLLLLSFTCRQHEIISIMQVHYLYRVLCRHKWFRRKLKNSRRYKSFKDKKMRNRVDSRVQFVWRLRVMYGLLTPLAPITIINHYGYGLFVPCISFIYVFYFFFLTPVKLMFCESLN